MGDRIFNFHDLCLILTIVECLLLALYRIAIPSPQRINNMMLGVFLLFVAIDSTTALIMWNEFFPVSPVFREHVLPYFYMVSQLAVGPLFFLYIHGLTNIAFRLDKNQALHFIPAVIGVMLLADFSIGMSGLLLQQGDQLTTVVANFLRYFGNLISIGYGIAALISASNYYQRLKENYSSFSIVEISWLSVLVLCFLISWGWSLTIILVADIIGGETADNLGTAHNYIRFVLLNALFAYSLLYTHRMLTCNSHLEVTADDPTISPTSQSNVLVKIQKGIEVQHLHLEPNINIEEFSARIRLPVKVVSYAINHELGTKFFEFINFHRIEVAKSLLADPANADVTVLEILLMSGFNNKSSFHRFFKRMVGMSPTEYRQSKITPPQQ